MYYVLKGEIMIQNNKFADLFIDPISMEIMINPVINTCGHTFEITKIEEWRANRITLGSVPDCPLCRAPLENLIMNRLIKEGLDVINNPENTHLKSIEDLTDEEQENLQSAVSAIIQRRSIDQENGVPDRLPEPPTFLRKFSSFTSGCCK